ncbi:hypothetical protein K458DRAFT_487958 [Lentithecium fluviatile CBS 122367]|uniref:Uncharacterized protein n=1 Tax=Lentithecium fluviatile CBS 122367 TaxID=1168545 RepID=A0A6G1IZ71_9PLEO|nr:hypothetical protein K458DRAFT_487958 [Lentithecium fluviatile CBS 122367]
MNNQISEEPTTRYPGHLPEVVPMRQMDGMDKTKSIEESSIGYSGHFPEDLPMRPGPPPAAKAPWRQRLRSFFTFSLSSYSIIHTTDGAARWRHISMVTIILLRTGMSALSILSAVIKGSIVGIVIYSLLAALSFWFTATCLAIIGDAEGDKQLKGIVVKRWHFDAFLGACVLIHAGLIVLFFFGLSGWGLELTSIGMWLAILGVAWIAGWQPELPTYQRRWVT